MFDALVFRLSNSRIEDAIDLYPLIQVYVYSPIDRHIFCGTAPHSFQHVIPVPDDIPPHRHLLCTKRIEPDGIAKYRNLRTSLSWPTLFDGHAQKPTPLSFFGSPSIGL